MRSEPKTIARPFGQELRTLPELASLLRLEEEHLASAVDEAPYSYSTFKQPKKSGGFREIRPPRKALRVIQRLIYRKLAGQVRYPRWMMGGVPLRSIFTHAKCHVGKEMVATFDVHSFFPSVTPAQVRSLLARFNIVAQALDAVIRLTTLEGQLPQGAPTSCFLANLVLDPADRRIYSLCRKYNFSYTRYVDDLAVSGDRDLRPFKKEFI